jgi:hypothetical protein
MNSGVESWRWEILDWNPGGREFWIGILEWEGGFWQWNLWCMVLLERWRAARHREREKERERERVTAGLYNHDHNWVCLFSSNSVAERLQNPFAKGFSGTHFNSLFFFLSMHWSLAPLHTRVLQNCSSLYLALGLLSVYTYSLLFCFCFFFFWSLMFL